MPRTKKKSVAQRNAQNRKNMQMRRTEVKINYSSDIKDDQSKCSSSVMEEGPTEPCPSSVMGEGPTEPCPSSVMGEGPTEPCPSVMEERPTENAIELSSEPCTESYTEPYTEPYNEHYTGIFTEIYTGTLTEKYSENLSKSGPLNQMQFDTNEEELFIAVPIDIENKSCSSKKVFGHVNYKPDSFIFGSFHQGDQRFGIESRGNQCVANSLCALFYGSYLDRLKSHDLDKVLVAGDQLYNTIIDGLKAKFKYNSKLLSFDEVPSILNMLNRKFHIVKLDVISGAAIDIFGDTQLPSLHQALDLAFQRASCNLVLIGAICSAVYLKDGLYYLFDSHSHDHNGLSTVDGFSMLTSFESMSDLVGFMYAMYNSMLIDLTSQYEVLPIVFTHVENTILCKIPENLVTAENFQTCSHNKRKLTSQCEWQTVTRGKNKAKTHSHDTKKTVEDKCHVEPQPDKPQTKKRRVVEDDDDLVDKRARRDGAKAASISEEEQARILQMVENEPEMETLDETSMKKLLLKFEKQVYKNQEMRIKFPDMPEKFMESELELNDVVQELHVIATVPELYHILVDLSTVQSLLQMLTHENTDISIAAVDLMQELTDVDTLNESEEGATALIEALLEGQVVALLVQNLERLDENVKEEADGVHNTLAVIENMAEFRPEMCSDASQQGLMQWLLKRIKAKTPFDANKLYAVEILAILLQNVEENRQLLGDMDGIDVILQQLAWYKRHDPTSKEEIEMMENIFNCLCSCLMTNANRARFLKGEGLQLMNLMLREKKMSRNCAIKVLNHAMTGSEGADNCQKFVDILGLRTVFPLFMKTPKQGRSGPPPEELEEHIASIIATMLRNCQGTQRQRLVSKFMENDHEKVERLLELHFKYLDKVRVVDDQIEREKTRLKYHGEDVDDDLEDSFYLRRLEAGLFTLQLIDYVMLEICVSGSSSIKQRVMQILNMRGGSVKSIRSIMREYAGNIGDAKDPEAKEEEQNHILQLVDKF